MEQYYDSTEDTGILLLQIFASCYFMKSFRSFAHVQPKVQCCKEKDPKNCYIMSLTVLHMAPNTTSTRDRLETGKNGRINVYRLTSIGSRDTAFHLPLLFGWPNNILPAGAYKSFIGLLQEELKLVREGLRACLQLLLQNFLQKEAGLDPELRSLFVDFVSR